MRRSLLVAACIVALAPASAAAAVGIPPFIPPPSTTIWLLIGKDSDRNRTSASASVYSAKVDGPQYLKAVGLATRKSTLTWRVDCSRDNVSATRSGRVPIPANRKTTVHLPVTVPNPEYCFVSASVDSHRSFSGRWATASVWVLAGFV